MKKPISMMLFSFLIMLGGANTMANESTQLVKDVVDHDEHCQHISQAEIAGLFARWNTSLQTGDAKKVVANYAESSILLPTLSNKPRISMADKLDYFTHFLAKKPSGKIDMSSVELDCNTAFDAGIYTFKFGDGSSRQARYTFTYKWFPESKQWLITSHHSSLMPEPTQASTTNSAAH